MVFAKWKAVVVLAGLACAGLAGVGLVYSQQSAPRPAAVEANQIVKISEPGKPDQECRILRSYRLKDGQQAHDVQILATGQTMTVIEGTAAPKTPLPLNTVPPSPPPPTTPAHAVSPTPMQQVAAGQQGEEFRTIQEAGKPPMKCRVMAKWRTPEGGQACQLQALDTGEIITIADIGAPQTATDGIKGMATRIFHWGRNTTPPPGVPLPPVQETVVSAPAHAMPCPVCDPKVEIVVADALKPKLGDRVKDSLSNVLAPRPAVPATGNYKEQWADAGIDPKSFGKPSADSTLPPDGKASIPVGLPKPPAAVAADVKVPPTPAQLAAEPRPLTNLKPSMPPVSGGLPAARGDKASDPLARPENFATPSAEERVPGLKDVLPLTKDGAPLGSASVYAAANGTKPPFVPVPMVTVPKGNPPQPPPAPTAKVPDAPNPGWYVNAFTPPLPPDAVPESVAMAQRQQMMQQAYPMMGQRPMVPPNAMMMQAGRGQVAMGYNGPLPPNPTMAPQGPMMPMMATMPVMPPNYATAMMPGVYSNQAMDRPGAASGALPLQIHLSVLQNSIFPAQREIAVMNLSQYDGFSNPQIVQVLLATANNDPSATVRAACVTGLVRMNAPRSDAVVETLNVLKADSDPRVRQAVETAMPRMTPR